MHFVCVCPFMGKYRNLSYSLLCCLMFKWLIIMLKSMAVPFLAHAVLKGYCGCDFNTHTFQGPILHQVLY